MKLREAYHHANQLKALTREVRLHLMSDAIMMHTLITHYYSKTDATMQDEITNPHEGVTKPASPETLIELYHFLHKQATELQNAISKAKRLCEYDIDVLSANNKTMRECARELTSLARKKPSETTRMQSGRKFNAEGNQVSFVYETKVVSTIDYDRSMVKKLNKDILTEADAQSELIDRLMVEIDVDFVPAFDLRDGIDEVIEWFVCEHK